jgi:hypothetical protein
MLTFVEFSNSVEEQNDRQGRIMVSIDNQTNETLSLFINGYLKGAELARVPVGSMREVYITKGKSIYISGGNTRREYGQWECNDDGEIYTIY